MRLSIIIPVYNVEQYIEKCLRSCLEQDIPHTDYEIIVVNDGSPDGSIAIAEQVAANAENITVISQENGGLSAARNTGMSVARGDYIWFVDSDDTIKEKCLSSLLALCINEIDVVSISHNIVKNNDVTSYRTNHATSGKGLLKLGAFVPAPFYIMRREFLKYNNLHFVKGIYHEDLEFTPRMLYLADNIVCTELCAYNYLQRENSITTTPNAKRAFDYITIANSLETFRKQFVSKKDHAIFYNRISLCINNALDIICQNNAEQQALWNRAISDNRNIIGSLLKSSVWKYKIQGVLFKMLPFVYKTTLYRFMQWFNPNRK